MSESISCSVVSDSATLWTVARLLCPWDSPGKTTRVGSHSLLQRIFPAQGANLGLLLCRQVLYHLSHQGSPVINSSLSSSISEGKREFSFPILFCPS